MGIGREEITNRFGFHKGTIEGPLATAPKHADLRRFFTDFADMLDEYLPDGRAKSIAFTELESCSMWAHKAVAEGAPVVLEDGGWRNHIDEYRASQVQPKTDGMNDADPDYTPKTD